MTRSSAQHEPRPVLQEYVTHCMSLLIFQCSLLLAGCGRPATQGHDAHIPQNRPAPIVDPAEEELSRRWRQEGQQFTAALNAYVARGQKEGWDKVSEDDEPKDPRRALAEKVLVTVRRANESGTIDGLRERFPPAHDPFIEILEKNSQGLALVLLLDDGRIVMRIGAPHERGRILIINDLKVETLPAAIIAIGRSPRREIFAVARKEGVELHRGWDGPIAAILKWPTGLEGVPQGFGAKPLRGTPQVKELIPFDEGDKALLIMSEGVFVLNPSAAVRLLPTELEIRERFELFNKEFPGDPISYDLSMEHGAVAPDGSLIAAGHQSSVHLVFDAKTYRVVGEIGHHSEYPHYAAFSGDGEMIAFNSCHFYNGFTIGVPTSLVRGLKTENYKLDKRTTQLEDGSRVYAAAHRNDEFIIGDANGYLRAFDHKGAFRWQHFVGSTIGSIDVSRDGKQLAVTSYAGFLCILDLDTGKTDPFTIGTSTHQERRRWLFWKNEKRPLAW